MQLAYSGQNYTKIDDKSKNSGIKLEKELFLSYRQRRNTENWAQSQQICPSKGTKSAPPTGI